MYKGKNESKIIQCRYTLDQKEGEKLLLHIRDSFKYGNVNLRSKTNKVYRLAISMNRTERKDFLLVINYFKKFSLKTTKSSSFQIWCQIINMLALKKHKSIDGLKEIEELRIKINKRDK
jgi:hypothetical protein